MGKDGGRTSAWNYDVECGGRINPVDAGIVQLLFGTCDTPRGVCR